eukprot:TRINITY_DN3702_c0_g2_i1.p1 TRINITY_DN3702_c0_g2~~TRINITY_DN3702_c0_g2_i1.p1  ORF type:complete len:1466 (-),score=230.12 TRINITY_DN3702_c0_g2_i1:3379-7776(-)
MCVGKHRDISPIIKIYYDQSGQYIRKSIYQLVIHLILNMKKYNMRNLMFENVDLPEGAAEAIAGLGPNLLGIDLEQFGREEVSSSDENKEEEKEEEVSEDISDSEFLAEESDTENRKHPEKSLASIKEEEESEQIAPFEDVDPNLAEDAFINDIMAAGTKRTYHFSTVGKERNGEPIYRLSELYVPEDPELKQRIVAHNKRHLMAIRPKTIVTAENKAKRKQKAKEIQQKLTTYYKTHKPKMFDESELWLPSTDHPYRRRIRESAHIVSLKEEAEPRRRLSSLSFDLTAYKAAELGKAEVHPAGTEAIHVQNWVSDVMENVKRSANRYQSEKIKEEKEEPYYETKRPKAGSIDEFYFMQGGESRFDERRSPLLRPRRSSIDEQRHDVAVLLENGQLDNHWGSIKDAESSHASYNKIKKIQQMLTPVFDVKREVEVEEKGELPIEMANVREIKRFQPINRELTNANWTNAVLLKPFSVADERAKAQYNRYMAELPHPSQLLQLHTIEENFDSIYQRLYQRAERKDSFIRNAAISTGYMRPRGTSFGLQGEAQPEQREGHGEITSLHMRVTKSKILKVMHSKVVFGLKYNKLKWESSDLENFHRPKLTDSTSLSFTKRGKEWHRHKLESDIWNIRVFKEGRQAEDEAKVAKDINQEIINAHEFFKNRIKLSLKAGKFCLMEHVDENPFFINNFGMASKVIKYTYVNTEQNAKSKTSHMGPYGIEIRLSPKDRIPLLGQLDQSQYKGITIIENNMYRAPIFYHAVPTEEYLLVKHKTKDGVLFLFCKQIQFTYVLRTVPFIYTVGQTEPKTEVYNPQSRQYNTFVKERAQMYVYKVLKLNGGIANFNDLLRLFNDFNDQIFKKFLKEIKVEEDRNHDCYRTNLEENFQIKELPEKVCRFEAAQAAHYRLRKCGIRNLVSADKITYATNKYISEEEDPKKRQMAKFVEEELLCTPWHLTQSYLHSIETKGMLMLKGVGDPSNSQGGYSYLKKPMKLSSTDNRKRTAQTELELHKLRNMQKIGSVTGTDADLRKLDKEKLKKLLLELGYKEEDINKKRRWERVDLLRKHSTQAELSGVEGDLQKFARVRITTDMQKKEYQKTANAIFAKQIEILSSEAVPQHLLSVPVPVPKPPPSLPPIEAIRFESNFQLINHKNIDPGAVPSEIQKKCRRIEFFWQHSARNLSEIPGLLIQKDPKATKIEVLKKTIRVFDREAKTIRLKTAYITDPKQIKQFKKRKSKKEVREAKRKGGPSKKKRPTSPSEKFSEEGSVIGGNKMIIKIQQPSLLEPEPQEESKESSPRPEEPLTIKLNLGDIQQAAKSMDYMQDILPKPKPTSSRKRLNNPEKQLNEVLEDIVDKCLAFDTTRLFHQPVKKKEAPDYYHKIVNPMDLGTMKNKAKRWEYKDMESFRRDIELIRSNAETYNGRLNFIAQQARNIEQLALELLSKQITLRVLLQQSGRQTETARGKGNE